MANQLKEKVVSSSSSNIKDKIEALSKRRVHGTF